MKEFMGIQNIMNRSSNSNGTSKIKIKKYKRKYPQKRAPYVEGKSPRRSSDKKLTEYPSIFSILVGIDESVQGDILNMSSLSKIPPKDISLFLSSRLDVQSSMELYKRVDDSIRTMNSREFVGLGGIYPTHLKAKDISVRMITYEKNKWTEKNNYFKNQRREL